MSKRALTVTLDVATIDLLKEKNRSKEINKIILEHFARLKLGDPTERVARQIAESDYLTQKIKSTVYEVIEEIRG